MGSIRVRSAPKFGGTLLSTHLSETLKARPKYSPKLVRKAKANAGQKVRSYKSESDLVLAEVS